MQRTSFEAVVTKERFILTYKDLTTAATSQTINLLTLPKGTIVKGIRIKTATAFTGGSVSACTVSVGSDAAGVALFAPAYDIYQAVAATTGQMTSGWKAGTYNADILTATFTSTTDNLTSLTAGVLYLDVEILLFPDLTATSIPAGTGGGLI